MIKVAQSFWRKVDKSAGPDACWPWLGRYGGHGYGMVDLQIDGRWTSRTAPAVTLYLSTGLLAGLSGGVTRHECDNRPCCNPSHLVAGTHTSNGRDASERLLLVHGEQHHAAKLNSETVVELRTRYAAGEPMKALATVFAIRHSTARKAISRKTWKHVE